MPARHVAIGHPVHAAEARGIRALVQALPDAWVVYSNLDLPSGGRGGQTYEHDAVVIAPHAVFTVELKSWGGSISGNRDRWTLNDGTIVQSPLPLVLAKARALKSRLQARRRDLSQVWVQGLVFVTAADASVRISADFQDLVATVRDIGQALTDPGWLGAPTPLTPGQRRAVEGYLADGTPQRPPTRLNDFELLQRLPSEDRPYDTWLAKASLTGERRILHAYTVAADHERERERQRAHAIREATLLGRLQGGPDILRYHTYFVTQDDPQRIVLQFEDTTPLVPLDAWVREHSPGLVARLQVAARLAHALAWVHEKDLVHRRLSPDAVLVEPSDDPQQIRLCAFDLARDLTGTAPTITGSSLGDPAFRCIAPEVLRTAEATARSDLFSLGATLVELFTGRPLFTTVDAVLRPLELPTLQVGERPIPRDAAELLARLLAEDPNQRPASAAEAASTLQQVLEALTQQSRRASLEPGREIRGTYELEKRLGRGATGTTWKAVHLQTGDPVVLKIASSDHAALLQQEAQIYNRVQHPHLVRYFNVEPLDDGVMLVLGFVDGGTAALVAEAGDPLDPSQTMGVARGLLGALAALHQARWLHRDVKPDNVMLAWTDATPTLLDLGLARRIDAEGDLAVGSVRYKDPLVYVESRWTPANDQFSAFLVIWELLTGAHPFGGAAPEPGQPPLIEAEQLPDSFPPEVARRAAAFFARALSPTRAERPASIESALAELATALGAGQPAVPPRVQPHAMLPADAQPDHGFDSLELSARTRGALARLGLRTMAELAALEPRSARRLPNVGSKTVRELERLVGEIRDRWPDLHAAPRVEPDRFYPPLIGDRRPLDELGRTLTPGLRGTLAEQGVQTLGDLAAMPSFAVGALPAVGPTKLEALRSVLRRLAGREAAPDSLDALDTALAEELGERNHAALAAALGLHDGRSRSAAEAARELGVTRQRVSQALDLEPLRRDGSVAHHLLAVANEVIPPVGLCGLDSLAAGLALHLPGNTRCHPIGWARLAALLLQPAARAADASGLDQVLRPPWQSAQFDAALALLAERACWPPVPRRALEPELWDALPTELQNALVRWGADAGQLLDALLATSGDVLTDRRGALYQPPVPLAQALAVLRPEVEPIGSAQALVAEAMEAFRGVQDDPDPQRALELAGFIQDGDRWVDPDRVQPAHRPEPPRLDPSIPRQRADGPAVPAVVAALASQAVRGGFRVVAMPPGRHHRISRQLAAWLEAAAPDAQVRYLHVDRLILDTLEAADLWKFVPWLEPRDDASWRLFHAELSAALTQAVQESRPGVVTVLGQPSLLGTLELMDWLSGFYEDARGGRHGLVVLAIPGGIHDDRVRLNERYNLPYTPDMAAVYLEETLA